MQDMGAKTSGAVGLAGTKEKEITLAAAQQLADHLRKTGKVPRFDKVF